MGLLDGKVAIVTGAGRGIGREHALLLAGEGASVMVNDLGGSLAGEGHDAGPAQAVADEIRGYGGSAAVNTGDVSRWDDAQSLIGQTVETFGGLNILVNNAGIVRDRMSFNMSEGEWDDVIRVVLKGSFAPSRFAATYWRDQYKKTGQPQNAVVINTTSESGLYGNIGQSNYGAAKAALVSLSLVMAREMEQCGVRVNAIAPVAATRMLATISTGNEASGGEYDPLDPAAIPPLVAWLCSDLASDVNGQVFAVNGKRIQLIDGFRPVAEIQSLRAPWTPDRIELARDDLIGRRSVAIPPFLPEVNSAG